MNTSRDAVTAAVVGVAVGAAASACCLALVPCLRARLLEQVGTGQAKGKAVTCSRSLDCQEGPDHFLALCSARMQRVVPPRQSAFRVYAILTWEDTATGEQGWVSGTNSESAFIGGSICAERSAAVQLREMPVTTKVTGVYLTCDLKDSVITPGVLCREYLLSCVGPDTPVHLGSATLAHTRVTTLRELYPCRSVYEGVERDALAATGRRIARASAAANHDGVLDTDDNWRDLIARAASAVTKDAFGLLMHPVEYAAAMLFADGTTAVTWQKAGLEYGTSVDAVTGLLRDMDQPGRGRPVKLVQVDQFGVLHAPFAPARAQLFERGCQDTEVAVYDVDAGRVRAVTVKELVPDCPSMDEIWPEASPSCC